MIWGYTRIAASRAPWLIDTKDDAAWQSGASWWDDGVQIGGERLKCEDCLSTQG